MNKTNHEFDLIIYIGRFQPLHNGHLETIKYANSLSKNVLVLVGSASSPRTIRNPWTFEEREKIIRETAHVLNLYVKGLNDYSYNDNKWIEEVGRKVDEVIQILDIDNPKIAIIGHDKDHTSYYLNYFPQWKFIAMPPYPSQSDIIDSTKIRQLMFNNQISFTDSVLPKIPYAESQVREFIKTPEFKELQKEWKYIEEYKKAWSVAPYEPTFVTVDAVVEQSGHILLVQRGEYPGKGLWAMPGGFINPTEKLIDGVIRELREETGLKVPEKVLRGSITHKDVFDDPDRSTRGRTITHTFLFRLDDKEKLPRVKGGDDAKKAKWFPLTEFNKMQSMMFEDHFSIIQNMLSRI